MLCLEQLLLLLTTLLVLMVVLFSGVWITSSCHRSWCQIYV